MRADKIIKRAMLEVGTKEEPAGSNNVKYNTWFYHREVSGNRYPWCCAFMAWLFRDTNLFPVTASCAYALDWFEYNKQIVNDPQPGDIVFFRFSTNARRSNHIGLVVGVHGDQITTIEGNTSINCDDNGGAVLKRTRNRKNIVAFARPAYEE